MPVWVSRLLSTSWHIFKIGSFFTNFLPSAAQVPRLPRSPGCPGPPAPITWPCKHSAVSLSALRPEGHPPLWRTVSHIL